MRFLPFALSERLREIPYNRNLPILLALLLWLASASSVQAQKPSIMRLTGSIDHRLGIEMTLERDGHKLNGYYFYDRVGRAIIVDGSVDKTGHVRISEGAASFTGTLVAGKRLTGTWRKAGSVHPLPFYLEVEPNPPTKQDIPGSALLEEKTLRVRGPKHDTIREILIRYPIVRGHLDAVTVRKLNQALDWRAVHPEEPGEKLSEDGWLDEIEYDINYNKRSILEVTYTVSGFGAYPDVLTEHKLLNLKTGNPIRAVDVFIPAKLQALANLVDKNFQEETREALADATDDFAISILEGSARVNVDDLNHFSVGEKGLTFIIGYGFPHVIKAYEPPGLFFYPYSTLKPYLRKDGPLAPFLATDQNSR